jgi:hypothetical protein
MPHSPGPFTVEELPDTAERALGLTHMICGPCQIPEEQGEPVAVAFTFSADDALLFASVLDLLATLQWLDNARQNGTGSAAIYAFLDGAVPAAIAKAKAVTP